MSDVKQPPSPNPNATIQIDLDAVDQVLLNADLDGGRVSKGPPPLPPSAFEPPTSLAAPAAKRSIGRSVLLGAAFLVLLGAAIIGGLMFGGIIRGGDAPTASATSNAQPAPSATSVAVVQTASSAAAAPSASSDTRMLPTIEIR